MSKPQSEQENLSNSEPNNLSIVATHISEIFKTQGGLGVEEFLGTRG
jgi:hypothetical protein